MNNFFACPFGKRPENLAPATRELAHRVLTGEYGRWLKETPYLLLEDPAAYQNMTLCQQQLCCIRLIAEKAPIRLTEGEYLAGSATLGGARDHLIPVCTPPDAEHPDPRYLFSSVSHVTLGFEKVMKTGYRGLREELRESMAVHAASDEPDREEKLDFLRCMEGCLDAALVWHDRYMKALEERIHTSLGPVRRRYQEIRQNLENVPENPPSNFREAVQALWFLFDFQRLCGNWPGIGRIDKMLGGFLEKDLRDGTITLEEAREYIAHFWIKGAEWANGFNEDTRTGSGDGQHYQNIILSGVDEDGNDLTNTVTYLVLDVIEELGISDFPVSVRLRPDSDPRLFRRVAEVSKLGGGILAIYNEPLVIQSLVEFGYDLREARNFANDGCWEVQVPGKTCLAYCPYDLLQVLQRDVLKMEEDGPSQLPYQTFEELFEAYSQAGRDYLLHHVFPITDRAIANKLLSLTVSLLEENCIASARSYLDRGPVYQAYSPHPGGMPDVANALHAIRHFVFEKKLLSLNELVDILKNDWEGQEPLRQMMKNKLTYYGNDDEEADAMMVRVFDDFTASVRSYHSPEGYLHPAGISTFGRQIEWAPVRKATPDGHRAGDFLAHNIDPTPGTDLHGATSVIKSYAKLDMTKLPCGTALTIKLLPAVIRGEDGTEAMESLLRGFLQLHGFFLQTDVIDTESLLEAQKHPERYESLSVRVSGWSARFNTLDKQWQDMVIQSTVQSF